MKVKSGYKRTEVGVIPEDWEVCKLATISSKITDGDHLTPKRVRQGYYLLSARNIRDGHIDLSDVDYVGFDEYRRMRQRCAPQAGDLLISCSGHGLGRVATVPEGLDCVLVRSAALVKLDQNKANSFFIQYWLQGTHAQGQISISKSLAAQPNLFLGSIESLRCPLPASVSEQGTIAESLGDLDALLSGLDRLIAKKRDLKQAAMQQLLTGQTRLPGFHGEWAVKRVCELGEVVTGGTPRTDVTAYWGGEYPWVTPTDISTHRDMSSSERKLTKKGLDAIRLLPSKTVLVTCIASIGKNAVLMATGACNQQINAVVPHSNSEPVFLYYMFEASKQYLLANSGITATRIISKTVFSELTFSVPPVDEQAAIAAVLSDMDAELSALETRRYKTRDLKQAMMQELLTGKTRLVTQDNNEGKL